MNTHSHNENSENSGQPQKQEKARRRWLRIALRLVFYPLLALLLLCVGIFIFVQHDSGQAILKKHIRASLESHFPTQLRINRITGDLLFRFSLEGVQVSGDEGPVFEADRISIHYFSPLLLKKILLIREIAINGCRLNLVKSEKGIWNVTDLLSRKKPVHKDIRSDFAVVLKRIAIDRTHIAVVDNTRKTAQIRKFRALRCHANLDLAGTAIILNIIDLACRLDRPETAIVDLKGLLNFDTKDKTITAKSVHVKTGTSDLTIDGTLHAMGPAPTFDLAIMLHELSASEAARIAGFNNITPEILSGSFTAKGTLTSFTHRLRLQSGRQSLTSQGRIGLDGSGAVSTAISGSLQRFNPLTLPIVAPPRIKGAINADFELKAERLGSRERKVSASFRIQPSTIDGYRIDSGTIDLALERDRLTIEQSRITSAFGTMDIRGILTNVSSADQSKSLTVAASIAGLNVAHTPYGKHLSGNLNFHMEAEAQIPAAAVSPLDPKRISGHAAILVQPSRMAEIDIHEADLAVDWNQGRLVIDRANISTHMGQLSTKGTVSPDVKDCRLRLDLRTDLATVFPVLEHLTETHDKLTPLKGQLSVSGNLSGWWNNLLYSGTVRAADVGWGRIGSKDILIEGRWQGSARNFLSEFETTATDVHIGEALFSSAKAKITVDATAARIDLIANHKSGEQLHIVGDIDNWRSPKKSITLQTLQLTGKGARLRNSRPVLVTAFHKGLSIDSFEMASEGASLSLSGQVHMDTRSSIRLTVDRLDIDRLSWLWQGGHGIQDQIQGMLSADVALAGTLVHPEIHADIFLENSRIYTIPESRVKLVFDYSAKKLDVRSTVQKNGVLLLAATGRMGARISLLPFSFERLTDDFNLDVHLKDVHLAWLPLPALHGAEIGGVINGSADVTGPWSAPEMSGDVALKSGFIFIKEPKLTYEDISGHFALSQNTLHIIALHIKGDREGSLKGSGEITLMGVKPESFNVNLTGEDVYLPYGRAIYAIVSPDLKLFGRLPHPHLTGRISVVEAKADLDRMAERGPAEIRVINMENDPLNGNFQENVSGKLSLLEPLSADVNIAIPKNAWLKGQGLEVEIQGNINLRKSKDRGFMLLGSLSPIRGQYKFRGKRFKITDGSVSFIGLEEINPNLDIEGRYHIEDVEIIAKLTGTAKSYSLSLDSDPQMDQADIISYMAFGRPTASLKNQQALSAEKAAMSLTGALSESELGDILNDAFHIDMFSIDTGGGDMAKGSAAVGKYVSPDVFVLYRQGFDLEALHQLEVTYEITPNISLEALIGDEKSAGADLTWEYDF